MMEKAALAAFFSIGSLTCQDILCQNTSNMPRGCRILRCSAAQSGRMVRDPTLFHIYLFPASASPDGTLRGRHSVIGRSHSCRQQPNRKPTGKRKESDASAQEGRERKRAAKRKGLKAGSRQQVEQAGKRAAPSRPRIHASALASPSR